MLLVMHSVSPTTAITSSPPHQDEQRFSDHSPSSSTYEHRYSVAPPMQPPVPPMPTVSEVPFEAVGVADFDVMAIVQVAQSYVKSGRY